MNKHTVLLDLFVIVTLLLSLMSMPAQAMPQTQGEEPPTSKEASVTLPLLEDHQTDMSFVSTPAQRKAPSTERLKIRFQRATFDPLAETPALPANLSLSAYPGAGEGYYLVQFHGPILPEWKEALQKQGALVLDYIPQFAYIVRMDSVLSAHIASFDFVRWVGLYQPAFRLSTDLDKIIATAKPSETARIVARSFAGEPADVLTAQLKQLGATIRKTTKDSGGGTIFELEILIASIPDVARLSGVAWVEPWMAPILHNAIARSDQAMNKNEVERRLGLYGAGQIVVVGDTGVSTGNPATVHADFSGRVFTGTTGPDSTCLTWADNDEHGTHVAGSVLGSGYRSGAVTTTHSYSGTNAGIAPEALLFAWGVCNDFSGLPNDLYNGYYTVMYDTDPRVRLNTNSWGSQAYGAYNTYSRETDRFIWDHQDMTVIFSAGNDGTDANSNGVVDQDSIGAPATAKNVVTVGASENYRMSGGYNPGGACSTWGTCWPSDFPTNPVHDDRLSNNTSGMVAFSSRGPTDDGRLKPDVVAPGSNIVSTRYEGAGTGWGVYDAYYLYMGGTSMATPLVAGGAAVVREFYSVTHGITRPMASLIKATLINGAYDMTPGQYGAGATQDVTRRPDINQGWGRVDLYNSLVYDSPRRLWFYQHTPGLSTAQEYQTILRITDNLHPLHVTAVWADYPGTEATNGALVNDLDLTVVAPGGTTYYGNDILGDGLLDGDVDHTNNVEGIDLASPAPGDYVIRVQAYNTPQGPQPFVLVASGDMGGGFGYLDGTVRDTLSTPLLGATVRVITTTGQVAEATTTATGYYTTPIPSGVYTVTAAKYGYRPATATDVTIISNTVTTQDFSLAQATYYIVSGTVQDATTGWPLYASLAIAGYPTGVIWNDPVTGFYSVTLPEDTAFDFTASAWVPGYNSASRTIGPLTAGHTENFTLTADLGACNAPGYQLNVGAAILTDSFDAIVSFPSGGWAQADVNGTAGNWATSTNTVHPSGGGTHSGARLAYFNSYTASSGSSTRLYRTSGLDLSGYTGAQLTFWMYHDTQYTSDDQAQVQVSTDGGSNWGPVGSPIPRYDGSSGWKQHSVSLSAYTGAGMTDVRIAFLSISAYGNDVHVDDVALNPTACVVQAGGLVVGNVYDANTSASLAGATVSNDSGQSTTTATTADSAVADSFYALFSPAGSRTFTATMSGYGTVVATTNVVQSNTVRQDFNLPAGLLSYTPSSLQANVTLGASKQVPFTLTNSGGQSASIELQEYLSLPSGGWTALPSAPLAVSRPGGAVVGGKFYIIGGESSGPAYLGQVQMYNPATGTWDNSLPTMSTPVSNLCVAAIGTDIYVPGGSTSTGSTGALQVFHTASNTWETITTDPLPLVSGNLRYGVACASYNGMLFVFGGYRAFTGGYTLYAVTQRYDPAASAGSRWTSLTPPPAVGAFGAALTVSNLIFYAGLYGGSTPDLSGVYAYDPASNTWTTYPSLQTARGSARMWAVGNMLLVGGGGWSSYLTSVERYDTSLGAGGSWSYYDSLAQERRTFAGGTDPTSGRLYAAAGWAGTYLSSAEQHAVPGDVPWLSESPTSGNVNSLTSLPIVVTFDAAGMTPGVYSAWLKIVNNTPYDPINIPVTMTVTSAPYGVTLEPPTAVQSGAPGAWVTYTLRLTNTGSNTDNFTLSKTGNAWTTDAPANVGPLNSGVGADVQIVVHIPAGASNGDSDTVSLTATSQGDATKSDSSSLTTMASISSTVTLEPPTAAQSGAPSALVIYTLRLTNTGATADTFTFSTAGNTWTTDVPGSIGPLAFGAGADVQVVVHIPTDVGHGASDTVTVRATSQSNPTQSDASRLTTTANVPYGVNLEPPTAAQSGAPGAWVTYTLRLTNTGSNTDNFTLPKTGNAWTTDAPANVGPIGSGAGVNLQVIVYVPSGAGIGATDIVTITAASQGNPTRSDTSALTTTAQSPESKVYLPIILK